MRPWLTQFECNPKTVVGGRTSNGFTLADPNDHGMLDAVGFDSSVAAVISDFVRAA